MGFLDDLDLDEDDVIETLILLVVLVLVIVLAAMLCCQLDKLLKERRRKAALVEEAGAFFSFHEAMPHSVPQEPGPLASLCKSSVFSLSGTKACPGHPYTSILQTPARGGDGGSNGNNNNSNNINVNNSCYPGSGGNPPLLLDRGQHVSIPMYPPSYFASAAQPPGGGPVATDLGEAPSLPVKPPVAATAPPPYQR